MDPALLAALVRASPVWDAGYAEEQRARLLLRLLQNPANARAAAGFPEVVAFLQQEPEPVPSMAPTSNSSPKTMNR